MGWLAFVVMHGPPDPVYEGHSVSWWLANPRWEKVEGGERLIEPKWDARAVPFLIKTLETPESTVSRTYAKLYHKVPLRIRELLAEPQSDLQARRLAMHFLVELKDDARP